MCVWTNKQTQPRRQYVMTVRPSGCPNPILSSHMPSSANVIAGEERTPVPWIESIHKAEQRGEAIGTLKAHYQQTACHRNDQVI